jgi:pimeloyl-ACP methyl ester carboxylesterase
MPQLRVNDVELYYERRGDGPSLLLIMGATGDGGVFERFAELLADEFTVVAYDRRGNGRSPRPPGWDTTSPEEQADDAAALLKALDLAPAAIFGTSSAGIFALAMLMRHPESVRGAVLHEPALFSLFDDPREARDTLTALIKEGMESGGQSAAFERFIRFVAGDANWEDLSPSIQARMLASADTYFGVEIGRFDTYLPGEEALATIAAPTQLLVSEGSLPYFAQAARRLAPRLGVEVTPTPGTHFAYLDHPRELAETVRTFLRSVSD